MQNYHQSTLRKPLRSISSILTTLVITMLLIQATNGADFTTNTCSFREDGRLFMLNFLNRLTSSPPYYSQVYDSSNTILFNFCDPFVPPQCLQTNLPPAFAYVLHQDSNQNSQQLTCLPFTSQSKIDHFQPQFTKQKGQIKLNITMETTQEQQQRQTIFMLDCQENKDPSLTKIQVVSLSDEQLIISGQTPYACPIFQLNSLWQALADNKIIFGIVLLAIGFIMLFYGILMTHLMIFLTAYFLTFALLTSIFTLFLTPQSSRIAIYFSLLFILFLSTLIAYALTRLVNFSIFFIGAFFGFILAAIINTLFCKLFGVYSIWSLIIFEVLLTIPFGLLTFKYSEQIIILSTSLAGSYMVVRPFSWVFGGFPNQFTLYDVIQNGELKTLPWTFFIYLLIIIVIFALGALYQLIKLQKKNQDSSHTSYLPQSVENQLDSIHQQVQKLITRYHSEPEQEQRDSNNYERMNELSHRPQSSPNKLKSQEMDLVDKKNQNRKSQDDF